MSFSVRAPNLIEQLQNILGRYQANTLAGIGSSTTSLFSVSLKSNNYYTCRLHVICKEASTGNLFAYESTKVYSVSSTGVVSETNLNNTYYPSNIVTTTLSTNTLTISINQSATYERSVIGVVELFSHTGLT